MLNQHWQVQLTFTWIPFSPPFFVPGLHPLARIPAYHFCVKLQNLRFVVFTSISLQISLWLENNIFIYNPLLPMQFVELVDQVSEDVKAPIKIYTIRHEQNKLSCIKTHYKLLAYWLTTFIFGSRMNNPCWNFILNCFHL